MTGFDQAVQELNTSAAALGQAATRYGEKRKEQERAHDRTMKAHDKWLATDGLDPAANEELRNAQADENARKRGADDAEEALRSAAIAFSRALADFIAALATLAAR